MKLYLQTFFLPDIKNGFHIVFEVLAELTYGLLSDAVFVCEKLKHIIWVLGDKNLSIFCMENFAELK